MTVLYDSVCGFDVIEPSTAQCFDVVVGLNVPGPGHGLDFVLWF